MMLALDFSEVIMLEDMLDSFHNAGSNNFLLDSLVCLLGL